MSFSSPAPPQFTVRSEERAARAARAERAERAECAERAVCGTRGALCVLSRVFGEGFLVAPCLGHVMFTKTLRPATKVFQKIAAPYHIVHTVAVPIS